MEDEKNEKVEFKIKINDLFPKFLEHLGIGNNNRIVFSGKFGIGKTYFLNKFFESKKDKYEVFHLSPVDYQINLNENIIEFLKYDILIELIKKNEKIIEENDYTSLIDMQRLLYLWGKDNFMEIFKTGVSNISKIGRPLNEIVVLTEKFWKFKNKMESGEKGIVDKFINEIKEKNVSETDLLSELLRKKIKEQKGNKKSVLILDDLERIDPENIFRILNIFSAHFNSENKELPNKFGFDKIIIVADITNLQSIFKHKYGSETDFSGYFNKFFSFEIFQFKNEDIVAKAIDEIISNFQIEGTGYLNNALGETGFLRIILKAILLESLKLEGKEKIDLRQILKGVKYQIPTLRNTNCRKSDCDNREASIIQWINVSIETLVSVFGGMEIDFILVLNKIKNNTKKERNIEKALEVFSYYLLKLIQPFDENKDVFQDKWNAYSVRIEGDRVKKVSKFVGPDSKLSVDISELFFDLLSEYVLRKKYTKENY